MTRPPTASTSTTDSPPPQSPITPPPYEHRLPPFFKVQIIDDNDSRMGEFSPSSSLSRRPSSASQSGKYFSLYPNETNHFNLPKLNLDRISSLLTPPSGHDLMHLFPFQPITELDRDIRHAVSNSNGSKPTYANTSTYFGKEEREFFRSGGSVSGRDLELRLRNEREKGSQNERGNQASKGVLGGPERNATATRTHSQTSKEPPTKRRKSIDNGKSDCDSRQMTSSLPPPLLAPGNVRKRVYPTPSPQQRSSQSTPSHSPSNSPTFQVRAQSAACATQAAGNPAPRRRAGKYTKRVFVHPNPLPNMNPPYLLANVYPPSPNDMNPTMNVYPLANPLPQKANVPYPPNPPPHSVESVLPQTSQFIEFAR